MGPHRQRHSLNAGNRRRQAGITAIGFLFLAGLVGIVGFGGLKLFPMYMTRMRLDSILDDMERDPEAASRTASEIRVDIASRMAVEGLRLPADIISVSPSRNGYNVRISLEDRQLFMSDIYFLLMYDRQVEIAR